LSIFTGRMRLINQVLPQRHKAPSGLKRNQFDHREYTTGEISFIPCADGGYY